MKHCEPLDLRSCNETRVGIARLQVQHVQEVKIPAPQVKGFCVDE